jgi:hypothetical protein
VGDKTQGGRSKKQKFGETKTLEQSKMIGATVE